MGCDQRIYSLKVTGFIRNVTLLVIIVHSDPFVHVDPEFNCKVSSSYDNASVVLDGTGANYHALCEPICPFHFDSIFSFPLQIFY